ncbi:MAG: tetratricopeptide repeat protein, partial [Alphaproteobacteria bacterium]|nr:tetratricopeptide repeat protein [Alphaproteobacteria bacterium]
EFERAIAAHDRTVALRPEFASVHLNRATTLRSLGRIEEAIAANLRAIALDPTGADAFNNLAAEQQAFGRYAEAACGYRLALALRPGFASAHSNLLFCLHYDGTIDDAALFAEYRRWERAHAQPVYAQRVPHRNDRDADRRLRIGYLSADFMHHPIAINIVGLFEHHDRRQFDIACYAEVKRPDPVTRRFEALSDRWRSTVGRSDQEVAAMIRGDGIDILVCMAGHTAGNRLAVCAHKPAPIQVSYGALSTTGLAVMDYWLTDSVIHPPDTTEMFTEELVRLPHLVLHEPPAGAPESTPLPAERHGFVNFGSFNNPAKMTDEVIALWARVLHAVSRSQLVLGYLHWFADPAARRRTLERFSAHGIAPTRIQLMGLASDRGQHLARMSDVDIALDPFPFNGCTATFEALWMGVPVITLAGRRWLGRMGTSFMTASGLADWVAEDAEAYVATARRWAHDLPALAQIRRTLRRRVRQSPLCDAPGYARSVEQAYRAMWRTWCHANGR